MLPDAEVNKTNEWDKVKIICDNSGIVPNIDEFIWTGQTYIPKI